MAGLPVRLLQLADSSCPTGGFAHSYGVEQLFRGGWVRSADEFLSALRSYVRDSMPGRELVFTALAWDAGIEQDGDMLARLSVERLASRLSRPARDAESSRGRALHRVLLAAHGPSPLWAPAAGSHAVLFGTAGALLGGDRRGVLRASAFGQASAMVQAAVRLGQLGPTQAQHVLGRLADPLERAVETSEERCFGDWHGFSPIWDLAQARHEHFGECMFLS